ncbi:copper chaperone PCu(A)C [Phaeovulum sp.]|uniref:copper chaperone PCu(A)C n=1 Tax=Phaeovulum sp. TaxID=2934796 RepID=UPI0039E65296
MTFLKSFLAASAALIALPAFADITVVDPYARVATPMSKSGAAFMQFENTGDADDRLIRATSDVAVKVELHTHISDAAGVMQMVEVPEGFAIPAHGGHALERGGDHVMFMGLNRQLSDGDTVTLTLTFEKAGEMVLDIPVDLKRGAKMDGHNMPMKEKGSAPAN